MALELIKEYLVGIGFQVDNNSFNNMEQSMNNAERSVKDFSKNSTKSFSETNDSLKNFFKLLLSSSGTFEKLFPELRTPFGNLIRDIVLLKKLYSDFNNSTKKKETTTNNPTKPRTETTATNHAKARTETTQTEHAQPQSTNNANGTQLLDSSKNLVEEIMNAKDAAKGLATEGGEALGTFSSGAVEATGAVAGLGVATGGIAIAVAAAVVVIAAFGLAVKELVTSISDLAKQDIEYEKLSRQLWTTKENAKEVDMALKTLGITMQDLWLSPTLLMQFNQLRKDSAELKLPKEYLDNLKIVQGIGLEFSRLKQLGSLAFQWIGNYILKYAADHLQNLEEHCMNLMIG